MVYIRSAWLRRPRRALGAGISVVALAGGGVAPVMPTASAQRTTPPAKDAAVSVQVALALTGVTVVDVVGGQLVPAQTVVVAGNRVRAVGRDGKVRLPKGARVVDARGKYLIPGLWDMHVHVWGYPQVFYPLFVANGVTGVRQMSEPGRWGLDSLLDWRRAIAAGARVGPRIVGTGGTLYTQSRNEISVKTAADGRRVVDSLKAAGSDFIKFHEDRMAPEVYFAIAARAREIGIPLDGHLPNTIDEIQGSDSGQRTVEHFNEIHCWWPVDARPGGSSWPPSKFPSPDSAGVQRCVRAATAFARNGTWFVPTVILSYLGSDTLPDRLRYWPASVRRRRRPGGLGGADPTFERAREVIGLLHRSGMPILAGTDAAPVLPDVVPGFSLHDELALLVQAGLTSLDALRAATLNPAKALNATDSLGTVAPGKLADLVLLDANPLADIKNTTTVRAVVANGRYFDRAALDALQAEVERAGRSEP